MFETHSTLLRTYPIFKGTITVASSFHNPLGSIYKRPTGIIPVFTNNTIITFRAIKFGINLIFIFGCLVIGIGVLAINFNL